MNGMTEAWIGAGLCIVAAAMLVVSTPTPPQIRGWKFVTTFVLICLWMTAYTLGVGHGKTP